MKDCIILIPLYKYDLYDYEILSLNRIFDLYYGKYDFCILHSYDYDPNILFDKYNLIEKYNIDKYKYINFDKYFFESSLTYNKLLLNHCIWENYYENYKYMFIYQIDGYVFNDELDYWINKNYDHIGAYEGLITYSMLDCVYNLVNYKNDNIDQTKLIRMNGGVSLRNLQSMQDISTNKSLLPFEQAVYIASDHILEEDLFYSIYSNTLVKPLDSIRFGYSHMYFSLSYSVNDFKYPFSAHAIHRNVNILNLIKKFNEENNLNYL